MLKIVFSKKFLSLVIPVEIHDDPVGLHFKWSL